MSPTASAPSFATASSTTSRRRPQIATFTPSRARACATPKPNPCDAAATAARRPVIPSSMPGDTTARSVDRAAAVAQRGGGATGAERNDLGADGDGRLLGRARADVEADRREDSADVGIREAGLAQPNHPLLVGAPRPHGTDVADPGRAGRDEGGHVELGVVREHADCVAWTELGSDLGQVPVG